MPLAAGFVGILPALGLLEEDKDGSAPYHLSWIAAVGWSCSVAFFGYAAPSENHEPINMSFQCFSLSSHTETSCMLTCYDLRFIFLTLPQIVKEQLAFPSGTATGQLISVLHQLPPPDTSIRRRGYHPVDSEPSELQENDDLLSEETPDLPENPNTIEKQGWSTLLVSFLASAILTVRRSRAYQQHAST
jgi:uncharacterized oligopeptide transporter (OPT) family protein